MCYIAEDEKRHRSNHEFDIPEEEEGGLGPLGAVVLSPPSHATSNPGLHSDASSAHQSLPPAPQAISGVPTSRHEALGSSVSAASALGVRAGEVAKATPARAQKFIPSTAARHGLPRNAEFSSTSFSSVPYKIGRVAKSITSLIHQPLSAANENSSPSPSPLRSRSPSTSHSPSPAPGHEGANGDQVGFHINLTPPRPPTTPPSSGIGVESTHISSGLSVPSAGSSAEQEGASSQGVNMQGGSTGFPSTDIKAAAATPRDPLSPASPKLSDPLENGDGDQDGEDEQAVNRELNTDYNDSAAAPSMPTYANLPSSKTIPDLSSLTFTYNSSLPASAAKWNSDFRTLWTRIYALSGDLEWHGCLRLFSDIEHLSSFPVSCATSKYFDRSQLTQFAL